MLTATVTDDSPLLVLTDGATTPVAAIALAHYTPVVSDRVLVERVGSTIVILGGLSGGGGGGMQGEETLDTYSIMTALSPGGDAIYQTGGEDYTAGTYMETVDDGGDPKAWIAAYYETAGVKAIAENGAEHLYVAENLGDPMSGPGFRVSIVAGIMTLSFFDGAGVTQATYNASPSTTDIRDILIAFGLMAPS